MPEHKRYNPDLMAGATSDESNLPVSEGAMIIGNSSGVGTEIDISGGGNIIVGNDTTATAVDASGSAKILVGDGTTLASVAVSGDVTISAAGAVTIAAGAVENSMVEDSAGVGGLFVKKYAQAVYDFAVDGGTAGTITLAATATIPDNALVTATHYEVVTTCTSSSDASTIALQLPTDGAISTAIAISDASNPWDAGAHLGSVITPIAVKTTGARAIEIVVAGGENITAGKIIFHVEYFVTV